MPTDADISRTPATVMVVDDVAANLQVMASELERGGYSVVVAQGGEEAMERAALVRPDLILLDVLMPGIDGFETCRRLKASQATRDIPVIFMTALSDTPQKLAGFDVGAVDYVTKPLDGTEVLARVKTQVALAEMRRELADRNARLAQEVAVRQQAEAALQRSNAELEQLAYVASHDMQEPLRMIASYLQLVEQRYQDKLDSDGREFIGYAVDGAKRMQVLINDLLTYSRVGTKARPFEPVALQTVVETALVHLRVAIEESGALVAISNPLPKVLGDSTQLVQLMQNLIANAIKFRGSAAPEVRIECGDDGAAWCLKVRDNGIGIEPVYFDRIFVLFQRLHGRGSYPGTGIGLALCKRIVERHGGRIWVESKPGQGSAFCFTLPHPAGAGDA
ncbi:sensor histidine kinase [Ideonella sp. YS5]|uniref:sensor histidine kinase n=1 Tax=Ideonella sp. YS5 TaxID=3453714 RepID=UPI003EEAACEE